MSLGKRAPDGSYVVVLSARLEPFVAQMGVEYERVGEMLVVKTRSRRIASLLARLEGRG